MSVATPRPYVTVRAASEFLSLSESTVRRLITSKALRAYRAIPGGKILLKIADIEKMLDASLDPQSTTEGAK